MNGFARPKTKKDSQTILFNQRFNGDLKEAFHKCEQIARSHYENFHVGTRLLPSNLRQHFYAIYAFCRGVDDIGDEFDGDRMEMLEQWANQLRLCYENTPDHPYFIALKKTIQEFKLPQDPFLKLIEANRRDQKKFRYKNFDELLDYCDHSANPVGHIVLTVFNYRNPDLHKLSDFTCTALQLTNFWQDVMGDYQMGRIYIPKQDMDKFGVNIKMIEEKNACPEFRNLMKFQVTRTRELFVKGYELVNQIQNKAKFEIALFTAGGLSILQDIEKRDYDVLTERPKLSKKTKFRLLLSVYLRHRFGLEPLSSRLFAKKT